MLLNIKTYQYSHESITELLADKKSTGDQLESMKAKSPVDLWMDDL